MSGWLNRHISRVWLGAVFAFLYAPLAFLVVFSFNSTRQDAIFTGFSLRWYSALMQDNRIVDGFLLSLKVALTSATLATILATLAAYALVRFGTFRGRSWMSAMLNEPPVMPEGIIGMSLLLLFVGFERIAGWPDRGALTIILGHTLLGMAYAAVVIESRLKELDRTLEEAAMDLGCRHESVFFLVMLPNMTQALAAAWLLTFTLSFDDVVISEFLSGPGVTTLPQVIFGYARRGINPSIYAAAALLMLIVTVSVVVFGVYTARQTAARAREQALGARDAA